MKRGPQMRRSNVPELGPRYWTLLCLASVFGANLGDFCSRVLGLGHDRGLPFLAAAFAAILLAERRAGQGAGSDLFYWGAIVVLRTAATNLGDLATHDFKLAYPAVIAGLAVLMALAAIFAARRPERETAGLPPVDALYWVAMLCAATLGTALGDYVADELGLGLAVGSVAFCVILAALLGLRGRGLLAGAALYWITVVAVRSAGTTVGDFVVSRRQGLAFGLPLGTACTGALMLAVLLLWRGGRAARLERASA